MEVSKQTAYRLRRIAEGKCRNCGKRKAVAGSKVCRACLRKDRLRKQLKTGYKPRKAGGPGRPRKG